MNHNNKKYNELVQNLIQKTRSGRSIHHLRAVSEREENSEYLTQTKSKISIFCDRNIIGHQNQMDQSEKFKVSAHLHLSG